MSIMNRVWFFVEGSQIFIAIDQSEVRNDQSSSGNVVTWSKIWDPSPKIP